MKKIKFKSYKKKSGTLIAFSLVKDFPIKVKRIFVINGKKILLAAITLTRNVHNLYFHCLGKFRLIVFLNKGKLKLF